MLVILDSTVLVADRFLQGNDLRLLLNAARGAEPRVAVTEVTVLEAINKVRENAEEALGRIDKGTAWEAAVKTIGGRCCRSLDAVGPPTTRLRLSKSLTCREPGDYGLACQLLQRGLLGWRWAASGGIRSRLRTATIESMDLVEARGGFDRATKHCDNLITVHRGHGGPVAGRRAEEVSLNRAVIVLTVASWQSAIQDMTEAALGLSAPGAGSPLSAQSYNVLAGRVRAEIGAFSTPNAQNTRKLMVAAGFDPRPLWTWQQRGGRGVGMVTKTPQDADVRIDEWLKVRHAIAHGHASMPQVAALGAVRQATGAPPVDPPIRLTDAEQCLTFFRRLTSLTMAGLANHLGVPAP